MDHELDPELHEPHDRFERWIAAELAGEISEDEMDELLRHLGLCARCRDTREAWRRQDAELVRAFGDRHLAASRVRQSTRSTLEHANVDRKRRQASDVLKARDWLAAALVLALGASFALGWLTANAVFVAETPRAGGDIASPRPAANLDEGGSRAPLETQRNPVIESDESSEDRGRERGAAVAEVARRTGPVELQVAGSDAWVSAEAGAEIASGSRLRTAANALLEIRGIDGSVVRLDRVSEVDVQGARRFTLRAGRIGSGVVRSDIPFEVLVSGALVTALGTRFDVAMEDGVASVRVYEGSVKVEAAGSSRVVRSGENARIRDEIEVRSVPLEELVFASSWMNDLLQRGDSGDPELSRRLDELLVGLGQLKIERLLEGEIRALGASASVPLLRFVAAPRSRLDIFRRREAARLGAELAGTEAFADLVGLLADPDAEVRRLAASGVERLAGTDLEIPENVWTEGDRAAWEEAYLRWLAWSRERPSESRVENSKRD